MDSKYLKICLYAGVTVIVTAIVFLLLYLTGGVWGKIWNVFLAVLRPMILGGVFCYLLAPLENRIEKFLNRRGTKSWTKAVAVALTYVLILLAIVILIVLVVLTMYRSLSVISIDGIKEFYDSMTADLADFENVINEAFEKIGLPISKITGIFGSLVSGVADFFSLLLFGIIFSVYFLLDGQNISSYFRRAFRLIFGEKNNEQLNIFLNDADQAFSGYIRGQFLDAFIVAVLTSAALQIAGVPSAILVGIFTGIGNLIPYCGPIVGYIVTAVVCIPGGDWVKLIIGFIVIAVVMFVDGNVINPRLLSSSIEVHPLLVIAALLGGGVVGGLVGMIVAVPIAALLKIQLDRYLDKKEQKGESNG